MHATAPGWTKGALELMPRGAADLTLLMTFKDQLVMTLKMRSAIAFVHAVFTCDQ